MTHLNAFVKGEIVMIGNNILKAFQTLALVSISAMTHIFSSHLLTIPVFALRGRFPLHVHFPSPSGWKRAAISYCLVNPPQSRTNMEMAHGKCA